MTVLEYITCKRCNKQQKRENLRVYKNSNVVGDTCRFCRKKTNVIPNNYTTTTEDALQYLTKIVFDPKNETSIFFQSQMLPVFEFLERQLCKEQESK